MPTDNNDTSLDALASKYNLSDLDDLIHRTTPTIEAEKVQAKDIETGGIPTSTYNRPGTFFDNTASWVKFGNTILNESFQSMGTGSNTNILQNFLSRLDRHGNTYVPFNNMNYGYTFITRPRLNMTNGNLISHPVLSLLTSGDENSVSFMMRMLLDTRLSKGEAIFTSTDNDAAIFHERAQKSPLFDCRNPFFTPLCNGLTGISGWPDVNLEAATMGEDFHSGDFTFIKGFDFNIRSTELTLEFNDVQGSIILSCIFYWCLMMALQAKGVAMAYPDDIYLQRLNYTVSIYRFITDSTRKNILWWSKATGCFPKMAPIGKLFDVSNGEVSISSARAFSVQFAANVIEYNNPGILYDFRRLMRNYVKSSEFDDPRQWPIVPDNPSTGTPLPNWNYMGLPDIISDPSRSAGIQLVWKTHKAYSDNWPASNFENGKHKVDVAIDDLLEERKRVLYGSNAATQANNNANNTPAANPPSNIPTSPANGNKD